MAKAFITKEFLNKYFETDKFGKDITFADLGYYAVDLSNEQNQIHSIQKYPNIIRLIPNPSAKVQIVLANKLNGGNIYNYIKNPCDEALRAMIVASANNIRYIENPSEDLQKLAIENNEFAIQHIKNPSEDVQKLAVEKSGGTIQHIKNPSEDVQKIAIEKYRYAIRYIKNPSKEIILAHLLKWGFCELLDTSEFSELVDEYRFDAIKLVEKPEQISPDVSSDKKGRKEKINKICELLQSLVDEE